MTFTNDASVLLILGQFGVNNQPGYYKYPDYNTFHPIIYLTPDGLQRYSFGVFLTTAPNGDTLLRLQDGEGQTKLFLFHLATEQIEPLPDNLSSMLSTYVPVAMTSADEIYTMNAYNQATGWKFTKSTGGTWANTPVLFGDSSQYFFIATGAVVVSAGAGMSERVIYLGKVQLLNEVGTVYQAAYLDNGNLTVLPRLALGAANQVIDTNNTGLAIGNANDASVTPHGVLWQNGQLTDFGTNSTPVSIGSSGTIGLSTINGSVQSAALWKNGQTTTIKALDSHGSTVNIGTPLHILDDGRVIGASNLTGGSASYYLLTPQ